MELKGSRTEQNLKAAFAGESQARNKYTFFSSVARKEGYVGIAEIFELAADNEKEHAKLWFKYLNGGANVSTADNLKEAISGENFEWSSMYEDFARVAEEEGFTDISRKFRLAGRVEKEHEGQFKECLESLEDGEVFKKVEETTWVCKNCGYVHYGKAAPEKCPLCEHDQGFFVIRN